ncbi:uncharacterized protein Bfra_003290 [Botrytis fragariae]|uniref:Uncharacterized protein n=1 Tax=Botrytis fragariae TaxID=1964551 RepID=A0A8H6AW66_9HELO|nr:uncharacterized protein Bfra_003290 [Botrytis fragariae]KAF5874841.1 hypothetical protein Bfra_003290 [Botrytis fragariae]
MVYSVPFESTNTARTRPFHGFVTSRTSNSFIEHEQLCDGVYRLPGIPIFDRPEHPSYGRYPLIIVHCILATAHFIDPEENTSTRFDLLTL